MSATKPLTETQWWVLDAMSSGWMLADIGGRFHLVKGAYGNRQNFGTVRRDVVFRLEGMRYIASPRVSGTWYWTLTDAGNEALRRMVDS